MKLKQKKSQKKQPYLLFALFSFLLVGGCGVAYQMQKITKEPPLVEPGEEVEGVQLNAGKIRFKNVGDTYTLVAKIMPENATSPRLKWKTSDASKIKIVSTTNTTCTIQRVSTFADTVKIEASAYEALHDYVSAVKTEVQVKCYLGLKGIKAWSIFQSGTYETSSLADYENTRIYFDIKFLTTLDEAKEWTNERLSERYQEVWNEIFTEKGNNNTIFFEEYYLPCQELSDHFIIKCIDDGAQEVMEDGTPLWEITFELVARTDTFANFSACLQDFFGGNKEKTVTMGGVSRTIYSYVFMNQIQFEQEEIIL